MKLQKIPEVGRILKLMVDEIEGIRILATGSSAFDISKYTGEPLTGRKRPSIYLPYQKQNWAKWKMTFKGWPI
ncbi:MAG: hypothetical protein H6573_28505 [Lewinellaceae bacterium]|nr:hypothetical protein [Lewinellaceae bacterium]